MYMYHLNLYMSVVSVLPFYPSILSHDLNSLHELSSGYIHVTEKHKVNVILVYQWVSA